MELPSAAPCAVVPVSRVPRRLLSLPLPAGFSPPQSPAALRRAAEAVADMLGAPALTPLCRELGPGAWMVAFLHGAPRMRRAATYEDGAPGCVRYIPRSAELAVADCAHGLLYLSSPEGEPPERLFPAFNGTLFPGRAPAAPFPGHAFDVSALRLLTAEARSPEAPGAPWRRLCLKSLTWGEPGCAPALTRRLWSGDGFAEFDATGDPWPPRLLSAGLTFRTPGSRQTYVGEFFQGTGALRASLAPATLGTLAALVRLLRGDGHA